MIYLNDVPNRPFTYHYSQPKEYHFCLDSIIFSWLIAQQLKNECISPQYQALDLCAGCGVIGFEISYFENRIERFDFLEIQEIFKPHFQENLVQAKKDPDHFRWLQNGYHLLTHNEYSNKYDLIVSNPPYFFIDDGVPSPSAIKNHCRFFLDDSMENLFVGIKNALKPGGLAFLLTKSGKTHGQTHLTQISNWLGAKTKFEIIASIRGTLVLKIEKEL